MKGYGLMIKYDKTKKHAYFNGYTFTRDEKTGYYLSSKNIKNNKRQRLHVYVWEYYNGDVPKGYEIHHKDENKYNNEISNFELLQSLKHRRLHADEFMHDDKRIKKARINLLKNVMPKAKAWHRTEEGRKWHTKHAKENWIGKKPIEYVCSRCGKIFTSLKSYSESENRFCSNNCKSAWRRKQGLDNETRTCVICGNEFITNKYSKSKTCSAECRRVSRCQTMLKSKV